MVPDIGGQKVIHLVAKRGLTEETTASNQVANGDVEVAATGAPVADLGERIDLQNILGVGGHVTFSRDHMTGWVWLPWCEGE